MEVVQDAGRVNITSEDEIKMTENATMNDALEKIGSCFDSRDRRKSKYLSYPYTNMETRHKGLPAETAELRTPTVSHKAETSSITTNPSNGSSSFPKVGNRRFRRNWCRKFICRSTIPSSPEFANTSAHELLSGLHSQAVDCTFPMESKRFDLVEWFFCRYRVSEYHDEAELATSLINNVKEGNIGKHVTHDSQNNIKTDKKRRRNNKTENAVRPKMKFLSGLSDVNISSSTGGSLTPGNELKRKRKAEVTSLPTGDSLRPGKKLKPRRKVEEVISLPPLQNGEITSNQSSGKCGPIPEAPQSLTCLASENGGTEWRNKVEAAPVCQSTEMASVNTKSTKCNSLVIDLQRVSPSRPCVILQKCNVESKEEQVLKDSNPKLCVSQEGLVGNIMNHGLSVSRSTSEIDTVLANQTGLKGKMERGAEGHPSTKLATEIPDLNGTVSESNSIPKEFENVSNIFSPEMKSEQSRSSSACAKTTEIINCTRLEGNGETVGTCLLLRFAPGVDLPSKEDLMATFFRFGPLKVSETQLLKDTGNAQIVFVKSAGAREAFRSLELNKPFGAALVGYKLCHVSAACPPAEQFTTHIHPTWPTPMDGEAHPLVCPPAGQFDTPIQPTKSMPMDGEVHTLACPPTEQFAAPIQPTMLLPMAREAPAPAGSAAEQFATPIQPTRPTPMSGEALPPLQFIRQNLQMMTSMLENSGNDLSPQMRSKLESELKNLMKKVNSKGGSSVLKSEH